MGWNGITGEFWLSYCGLKTVQYPSHSRAAWASAGRTRSDHFVLSMSQVSEYTRLNSTPVYQFAGRSLNGTKYPFYGSYGGLNGGSTSKHDTAGAPPPRARRQARRA